MKDAKLVFREKLILRSGLLRDGTIWKIPRTDRYPQGIRYRLALIEIDSGKLVGLFDNHHPKGHHRHWEDGRETIYIFETLEKLVEDYLSMTTQEEKKRENQKD